MTAPAPPAPSRPKRPWKRAAAGSVALALVLGGVVVALHDSRPSPKEQLAAVRAFVAKASSAHYEAELHMSFGTPGADVGQQVTTRMKGSGDIGEPARSHSFWDGGDSVFEEILTDDGSYSRQADDKAALEDEEWMFEEGEEGGDASAALGGISGMLLDFAGTSSTLGVLDPTSLKTLIGRLRDPEAAGGGAIRATLTLQEAFGQDLADEEDVHPEQWKGGVTVELSSGPGGRLDRMVWTVTVDDLGADADEEDFYLDFLRNFRLEAEFRLADWDKPVKIEAPADADVTDWDSDEPGDHDYSSVDTEGLKAFTAFPLLGLTKLPAGWELATGVVELDEDLGCDEVTLGYEDPAAYDRWLESDDMDDADAPPSITLRLFDASCRRGTPAGTSFAAGTFKGTIEHDPGDEEDDVAPSTTVRLTAGKTFVIVEASNVDDATLTDLLAGLAPLSLP